MSLIAHLSDFHLLEPNHAERTGVARRRLAYLTARRANDSGDRLRRGLAALTAARESGADHVVITGDLTEDGLAPQFELFAEILAESRLPPSSVTLIPGNHDSYIDGSAFERALHGPLAAYAATSTQGVPVVLRDTTILPISTSVAQHYTRSAGAIDGDTLRAAIELAEETRRAGHALVLAMHHPPRRRLPIVQWIDGLAQHAAVGDLLQRHDHVHVLYGHLHVAETRAVTPGEAPRIFGTEAVVDGTAPLRLYEVRNARLAPVWRAAQIVPELAIA